MTKPTESWNFTQYWHPMQYLFAYSNESDNELRLQSERRQEELKSQIKDLKRKIRRLEEMMHREDYDINIRGYTAVKLREFDERLIFEDKKRKATMIAFETDKVLLHHDDILSRQDYQSQILFRALFTLHLVSFLESRIHLYDSAEKIELLQTHKFKIIEKMYKLDETEVATSARRIIDCHEKAEQKLLEYVDNGGNQKRAEKVRQMLKNGYINAKTVEIKKDAFWFNLIDKLPSVKQKLAYFYTYIKLNLRNYFDCLSTGRLMLLEEFENAINISTLTDGYCNFYEYWNSQAEFISDFKWKINEFKWKMPDLKGDGLPESLEILRKELEEEEETTLNTLKTLDTQIERLAKMIYRRSSAADKQSKETEIESLRVEKTERRRKLNVIQMKKERIDKFSEFINEALLEEEGRSNVYIALESEEMRKNQNSFYEYYKDEETREFIGDVYELLAVPLDESRITMNDIANGTQLLKPPSFKFFQVFLECGRKKFEDCVSNLAFNQEKIAEKLQRYIENGNNEKLAEKVKELLNDVKNNASIFQKTNEDLRQAMKPMDVEKLLNMVQNLAKTSNDVKKQLENYYKIDEKLKDDDSKEPHSIPKQDVPSFSDFVKSTVEDYSFEAYWTKQKSCFERFEKLEEKIKQHDDELNRYKTELESNMKDQEETFENEKEKVAVQFRQYSKTKTPGNVEDSEHKEAVSEKIKCLKKEMNEIKWRRKEWKNQHEQLKKEKMMAVGKIRSELETKIGFELEEILLREQARSELCNVSKNEARQNNSNNIIEQYKEKESRKLIWEIYSLLVVPYNQTGDILLKMREQIDYLKKESQQAVLKVFIEQSSKQLTEAVRRFIREREYAKSQLSRYMRNGGVEILGENVQIFIESLSQRIQPIYDETKREHSSAWMEEAEQLLKAGQQKIENSNFESEEFQNCFKVEVDESQVPLSTEKAEKVVTTHEKEPRSNHSNEE